MVKMRWLDHSPRRAVLQPRTVPSTLTIVTHAHAMFENEMKSFLTSGDGPASKLLVGGGAHSTGHCAQQHSAPGHPVTPVTTVSQSSSKSPNADVPPPPAPEAERPSRQLPVRACAIAATFVRMYMDVSVCAYLLVI